MNHFNSQILTKYFLQSKGNVCLGILNGSEVGLENENVIGGKEFYVNNYFMVRTFVFSNHSDSLFSLFQQIYRC